MEVRLATGIYFKPTERAVKILKATAVAGLAAICLYSGFGYYGDLKQSNDCGPDKIRAHFLMNEVQKAIPQAEGIIKK